MHLPKPEGLAEIPLPLPPHPTIMTKQDALIPNLFLKLNSNSFEDPRVSLAVWEERKCEERLPLEPAP